MCQSSPFFVRRKERKTCTRKNGGVLGEESRGVSCSCRLPSNTEVKRCRMRTNIQAAWLVNKAFSSRAQVRRATKVHQFAFFKESSKFLRPLLTYVVVLDFPPSSFFYSLQGGVMESLVTWLGHGACSYPLFCSWWNCRQVLKDMYEK